MQTASTDTRESTAEQQTAASADDAIYRTRIGTRISLLRQQRGLTIAALATAAGISRGQLHRILKGECIMRSTTQQRIAKALGLSDLWSDNAAEEEVNVADTLTNDESRVLLMWRSIEPSQQKKVLKELAFLFAGLTDADLQ